MKKQLQRNYDGFIAALGVFVLTFLGACPSFRSVNMC
jgi:hypothetical protein